MTPKQLKKLGEQLGAGWQSKLARLLPCNVRTVQYWLKGERQISEMVAHRIRQVINSIEGGETS